MDNYISIQNTCNAYYNLIVEASLGTYTHNKINTCQSKVWYCLHFLLHGRPHSHSTKVELHQMREYQHGCSLKMRTVNLDNSYYFLHRKIKHSCQAVQQQLHRNYSSKATTIAIKNQDHLYQLLKQHNKSYNKHNKSYIK